MKMINYRRGTILVEAVVSTVIIAISLTLIMQSLLSSYQGLNVQKDYAKVLSVLQDNLSRSLHGVVQSSSENSPEDNLAIEQSSVEVGENLKKQIFDARWHSGRQEHNISFATFIYNAPDDQT